MTNSSQQSKPAGLPWPFGLEGLPNPFGFLAPKTLNQPIDPGWTFGNVINVTEQNSSAPDTERDIVSADSYGRQLGRIIDALAVLIADRPDKTRHVPAFNEFSELEKRIEKTKTKAAARRLDRIAHDLATLKQGDPEEYRRLADVLRQALKEQS